jgi:hypothetical protein
MHTMRRLFLGGAAAVAAVVLTAGPGLAHECVNASRNGAAGAQLVFGGEAGEEIVYMSKGLQQRVANGQVDLATGEGFHGLIGLDLDGDAVGDLAIYLVGPTGEVPLKAQYNGPTCKGLTNIDNWFEECFQG